MSLHHIKLFQGLSNVEFAKILGKLDQRKLPAGVALFRQGDDGDSMYIIARGKVELFAERPDGTSQPIALLGEGDTIGEMALLTGEPRSASAIAALETKLFVMDMETFQSLIAEHPAISSYFIQVLSQRLIQTNSRLQASKEAKSQWIAQQLEQLPATMAEGVLAVSLLPRASAGLLRDCLGIDSVESALVAYPKLAELLRSVTAEGTWYAAEASVRPTLNELFMAKHGYDGKKQWIGRAAEYYWKHGEYALAAALFVENDAWDAALDVVEGLGDAEAGGALTARTVALPESAVPDDHAATMAARRAEASAASGQRRGIVAVKDTEAVGLHGTSAATPAGAAAERLRDIAPAQVTELEAPHGASSATPAGAAAKRLLRGASESAPATVQHDGAAPQSNDNIGSIYLLLDRCPGELLFRRFAVLGRYLKHGIEHAPREAAFAKVEAALEKRQTYFSPAQSVALYEWGAELYRKLGMMAKALEYLQMAQALASSQRGESSPHAASESEDRTYQLAKQKLDSQRSRQQAEKAGSLWSKSRLTGVVALALALLSILFFHFAPPVAGLSRGGMDFIGIGIAAVMLWIVNIVPDYIVALVMAMLWVLMGLVTPETALSGFATPTWLYMLFILAIGAVITKSGILYRLSLHALKRFPAHYRGQLWGIVAGGAALNPLIPSSSAKIALGVPIAQTLSESMGFRDRSKGAAGLGLAAMVFYGFTAPFVLTGSYTNVMAYGLVPDAKPLSWFEWFLYALPAFIVFTVVMLAVLGLLFRKAEPGKAVSKAVLDEQLQVLGKLTRDERITVLTVAGCILLLILQPLHGIDNAWVMLLGFAVLVISGVLDTQTVKSGIDWTFLLFIGIAFSFAEGARQLGIVDAMTAALGDAMTPFLANPTLFLIAVIMLSFLVTLVVRDDPAVILLVISMYPLAAQAGIHPWVLVFVILLSTDPFFFTYQSPTYLTGYYSSEGRSFSHRQGQLVALGYGAAVIAASVASVPYWKWIGLIR